MIKVNGFTTDEEKCYYCPICKDLEYIIERNKARDCKCREAKNYQRILARSGISKVFQQKSFSSFNVKGKPKVVIAAKEMAENYVKNFHDIKKDNHHSIAFLGQVGSGKTHLSIAIANYLMKANVGVLYMQYREAMTGLKQNIMDEVYYQNEIAKYKTATVLLIDDLYKGKISPTDHNIMFEIINYRYLKGAPVIISSEYKVEELLSFDEAIGSRLIEICRGRIIEFEGMNLNHRLAL
ncbi:ATP-binding protein [Alkaliphilus sp. B6464]|uniref:ATP-binding protein n=1 Tax=Alkaliphilus sp. B6464 TaxID=2731219 RepID=UPI0020121A68|nr:ATP-binding protein [Alkaliphilus sp. B6464]